MLLNPTTQNEIESHIGDTIIDIQRITGGDISDAFLLQGLQAKYFIKINTTTVAAALFETEAKGLQLLSQVVQTPDVYHQGVFSDGWAAFLLLQFVESGKKDDAFWVSFGAELAQLHHITADVFGLDHDNFIGRLPQQNHHCSDWSTFYSTQRLIPQVKLAYDKQLINKAHLTTFDRLYKNLDSICPEEPPALIHGDLWSGNFMSGKNQQAVFIDPSVAYAHREMDLAMSLLFGGFDKLFYESYNNSFPLVAGFDERVPVYQLYYLLVHLNLFGRGYLKAVEGVLKRFG